MRVFAIFAAVVLIALVALRCGEKAEDKKSGTKVSATATTVAAGRGAAPSSTVPPGASTTVAPCTATDCAADPSATTATDPTTTDPTATTQPAAAFDWCAALAAAGIDASLKTMIDDMCGAGGTIAGIRKAGSYYEGTNTSLDTYHDTVSGKRLDFEVRIAIKAPAALDDAWALERLQFLNFAAFKQNYQHAPNSKVSLIRRTDADHLEVRYDYEDENGAATYQSQVRFLTLGTDQAYAVESLFVADPTNERFTDQHGLMVLAPLSAGNVELLGFFRGTLEEADAANLDKIRQTTKKHWLETIGRSYANLGQSSKAKALLTP
jgi:hypothetical protein